VTTTSLTSAGAAAAAAALVALAACAAAEPLSPKASVAASMEPPQKYLLFNMTGSSPWMAFASSRASVSGCNANDHPLAFAGTPVLFVGET
jgi:hypothetical protein